MQLSQEEKELFFEVAKILQRESNKGQRMLGGYEDSFDGDDVAVALYGASGFLEHRLPITPKLDPSRPGVSMDEINRLAKLAMDTLVDNMICDIHVFNGERFGPDVAIKIPPRFNA